MSHELARTLAYVAGDLDRRGYAGAGVVRQAARALLDRNGEDGQDGCRGCGAALPYAGRGRPRVWCGEPCRRRATRAPPSPRAEKAGNAVMGGGQ